MGRKAKIITKSPYRLRDWRNHRGITLEKVGEALGMTGQNYGKIERGQVDLLPNYIEPLAQLFDVDATDLMLSPKATAKAARGVPIQRLRPNMSEVHNTHVSA